MFQSRPRFYLYFNEKAFYVKTTGLLMGKNEFMERKFSLMLWALYICTLDALTHEPLSGARAERRSGCMHWLVAPLNLLTPSSRLVAGAVSSVWGLEK
jgi:hypothetical protein